jgi:threonine dehydrogenase-like Zn-dependent dehydrogenase
MNRADRADQPGQADQARRGTSARAVVLEDFAAALVLREFVVPTAGAGEIVVAGRFGGICGTDLHLQQGHLAIPTPLVLGHEALGVVRELGLGVAADAEGRPLAAGDDVMWASSISCGTCAACRIDREPTLCEARRTYGVNRPTGEGSGLNGSWAEAMHLRAGTTAVKVPPGIDYLAAMSLACAGPTMIHALYERRPVRVGEVVVVQGSGPVGLAAAAIAQLSGAGRVVIVGGPAQRLEIAKAAAIGDAHVNIVDAEDAGQALAEVWALTGGRGADLVIECTGVPAAIDQGLRLGRRGGSYLVVGQYTDAGNTSINPHQIVLRQLTVLGSWAFTGAHLVQYVRLLPALCRRFDLRRLVTTFPLDAANSALRALAEGAILKAVLTTGSGHHASGELTS